MIVFSKTKIKTGDGYNFDSDASFAKDAGK